MLLLKHTEKTASKATLKRFICAKIQTIRYDKIKPLKPLNTSFIVYSDKQITK
uniref:Uncharacterized protein n=1 Tax=Myoviridae sp. ctBoB21 TaxID=2827287 RepID=A0A8S5R6V3_9CAUD|nr:MAG TPA: hypothetical protein [Myoviridae sp. ctBoB21]